MEIFQKNLNQETSSYQPACLLNGRSIKSPVKSDCSVENANKTGNVSMPDRPSTAGQNEVHVCDLDEPMKQHKRNGNCMWYAINEACGGNGNRVPKLKQGSDINALNLKRLIYEKLFAKLKAKCQNLKPVNFDQEIAVINGVIRDGFSGPMANGESYDLNEAQFDLGNESSESIPDYFEENGIKDVSDITYDQLKTIMAKLSKASAKARNNMAFFKYLADCPKDGHPFANVEYAHPLCKLCDNLLTISKNSKWLGQGSIDPYALLRATRYMMRNDDSIYPHTASAAFFAENSGKLKEICETYNNDPYNRGDRGNPIALNSDGMPMPKIRNIIDSMFEIVQSERYSNSYTSSNMLPLISQMLGRDVLLIDATVYGNEGNSETTYSSKICAFELHEANGTMTRYAINEKSCKIAADGTISFNLERDEKLPVLKKDSIVIAEVPAHYCAPKSFAKEGLRLICLNEQGEMEEISITNLAQLGLRIQGSSQEVQSSARKAAPKPASTAPKAMQLIPYFTPTEAPREISKTSTQNESSWSNLFSEISDFSGLLLMAAIGVVILYFLRWEYAIMYFAITVALNFLELNPNKPSL